MARKSKSRQEGRGRSRRRSALLFLARWSLVLLIWTGFLAGGIVLWYARDLPDTSRLNEITRRPAVTLVTADGEIIATYGDLYGTDLGLDQLPAYLSGWDVALMPFAMNESTQFISPTKTPEYLAGGKPVVSTPIKDVVRHYGHLEGVQIASTAEEFVEACEKALERARNPESGWLAEADLMLSAASWDTTQARMAGLVAELLGEQTGNSPALLVAAE